jgi:hypothetical protein
VIDAVLQRLRALEHVQLHRVRPVLLRVVAVPVRDALRENDHRVFLGVKRRVERISNHLHDVVVSRLDDVFDRLPPRALALYQLPQRPHRAPLPAR